MKINAKVSILANYQNEVNVRVRDDDSGIVFLEFTMTHEQFVNAAMNRLGESEVVSANVAGLQNVGKKLIVETIEVELPSGIKTSDRLPVARALIRESVPCGGEADLYLRSQGSFVSRDGKEYARTTIRSWVEKEAGGERA